MRRLIIIALLFLLMSALPFLQVVEDRPFHPKSLAALGFVLLAAYTLGEIASRLNLPKITGYIITGLLFGPYVINLFSVGVVEDLKLINRLAIGLIALTAGAEMKLESLKSVLRSLGWITLIKGLLILAVVTATIVAARPLIPFLVAAPISLTLAVGMIFGVLAIGTSPAATIAVINETQSRGRLSDLTLGVAVAKDVVMVVLLAIAISLARLFSTPGARFDPTMLVGVGEELLLSVAVGALLGVAIIAYIRLVHAEMWLFLIGVIFLNTFIAERLHLEVLLTFIVAGFVVQNFSKFGDRFIHPVEDLSLPVYVVFFSIAGAGLNLHALRQVWLVALILVLVRIAAIFAGSRIALGLAKESDDIKRHAWLSFISQAGVVLGLAIIVENSLPGLGGEIKTIVLGTLGMNLISGPIAFKFALGRMKETKEAREQREAAAALPPEAAEEALMPAPTSAEDDYPHPAFESPELNDAAIRLRTGLIRIQRECEQEFIDPQAAAHRRFLARMRDRCLGIMTHLQNELASATVGGNKHVIHCLRRQRMDISQWLQAEITGLVENGGGMTAKNLRQCFDKFGVLAADARETIVVSQELERFIPLLEDSFYVRSLKRLKRWRGAARRLFGAATDLKRDVRLRRLAQFHLATLLPQRIPRIANLLGAQRLLTLQLSRQLYDRLDGHFESIIAMVEEGAHDRAAQADLDARIAEARQALEEKFDAALTEQARLEAILKQEVTTVFSQSYDSLLKDLALAGTFELPRRRYRTAKIAHA